MKKLCFSLLSCAAAVLLLLSGGCFQQPLAQNPYEDGPVIIGAVLPLSGKYQEAGERMLNGLRYAEYELNNRRGINNRQVKLQAFDSQSSPEGARDAFAGAAKSGASGIICGYSTGEALSILPLAETFRVPAVIPLATADAAVGANAYVFRTAYTDRQQGESLAAYLWYWRQMHRISVLLDSDPSAEYERNTARATASAFRELGGTVTNMPVYRGDNFKKAVEEALVTGPQAIIVSARGDLSGRILKEIREKGYRGTVCGLDAWDSPAFFKQVDSMDDPGDCLYVSFFTPANPVEEFIDFTQGFRQKFFHEPGCYETLSYDALKMLAIGLGRAKSISDFKRNWLTIRNHFGAAATYTMLPDGNVDRTMFINAVEPKSANGISSGGRLIRSFMHSKLASYRY